MLQQFNAIEAHLNQVILGKPQQIKLALCCLLAKGHLLLEDLPGMGVNGSDNTFYIQQDGTSNVFIAFDVSGTDNLVAH